MKTNALHRLPRLCAATAALSLFTLLVGGCASATDKAVRGQAEQFQTSLAPAEVQDPQVNSYLQQIGQRIVQSGRDLDAEHIGPKSHFDKKESENWMFNDIQFHLVNSKTLNAFTTGGNHVYIYNQLLQLCENEDQLAAVMSHEYAHIYCRHVQEGSSRQLMSVLPALLLGGAGYLAGGQQHGAEYAQLGAGVGALGGQIGAAHFTRADEDQADEYGQKFYAHSGWDPRHFGDFFAVMAKKAPESTPEFLSDHPSLVNRVKTAEKRAPPLMNDYQQHPQPPILSPDQFAVMKQRAQQVAARTPDDKSLQNTQQLLAALPRSCLYEEDPNPPDAKQAQQEVQRKAEQAQKNRANAKQSGYKQKKSHQSPSDG
jgi:predicted Zn-dependent protease